MNKTNLKKLPYRKGVIGVIIDESNNYLVVQMISYADNQWRFAGGGIDENESEENAVLRELQEELGSKKFEIVKKSSYTSKYDWPIAVVERRLTELGHTYRGQVQSVYLIRFTGKKEEVKPDPKEIRRVRWIAKDEIPSHFIFPNQWEFVEKVLKEFKL